MTTNEEIIQKYDIKTNHSQEFFKLLHTMLNEARQDEISNMDKIIDDNKFNIYESNLPVVCVNDIHSQAFICEVCNKPMLENDIVTISRATGKRIHKNCK